jgi:transcriptional antiterminator NusG
MVCSTGQWVAIWTRSRHEKSVHDQLAAKALEVFLPLVTVPSSRKDRRLMVEVPAFPGYLFAKVYGSQDQIVNFTRGVVRILGPSATEYTPVPEGQVEAVRRMVESELRVDPYPYMKVGTPVRMKSGPLRGLEGYIVEKRRQLRFVVAVDLLQKGVATEVSADQVEPA